jgi:PAS domain S-box-containing protein
MKSASGVMDDQTDITDRGQTQETLRQSADRLRGFIEAAPVAMCMLDRDMRYLAASRRWLTDFKLGIQDIIGRSHYDVFPDIPLHWKEVHRRCLKGAVERCDEDPFRRADGSLDWVRWEIQPWRDRMGDIGGIVIFSELVTARKRAEEALREGEARFRRLSEYSQAVVDNMAEGLYTVDTHGLVTYINPAAESLFGWTSADLLGRKMHDMTHYQYPDGRPFPASECAGLAVLQKGILLREHEDVFIHKDGRFFPVVYSASPLRAEGKTVGIVVAFRDDTQRRRAEEEIHRLNRTLEHRVAERTAQLAESNQALEAFGYSVSHDLRAPLRTMQGFAQALQEDYGERLDEDGRKYTDRIVAGARRMDRLIMDLLAYSRLRRSDLVLKSVDVMAIVTDATRQLATARSDRPVQIAIVEPLPAVTADRTTLTQVMTNLLSNAVKFVAPGVQPKVNVYAEHRDGLVRLWIEDNGIGIACEHQERIFRVFERLHGSESYPGTGIGLAIVQKGIERMGGRVGVESHIGVGSRFWIELAAAGGVA